MRLRDRFTVEPRHRQGMALAALIYTIAYAIGHAHGRAQTALEALNARTERRA